MLIVALSRRDAGTCAIVDVDGELDGFNCRLLADTLAQAIDDGSGDVIVDVGALGYLSESGVHCLERAASVLSADGRALHLVCPANSPASTLLCENGRRWSWVVHADLAAAVRSSVPARTAGLR